MHNHWALCGGRCAWFLATTARWSQSPATQRRYATLLARLAESLYGVRGCCITRCHRHVSSRCAWIRRRRTVESTGATRLTAWTCRAACCRAVACGPTAVAAAARTASRTTFFNVAGSFSYSRRQERSTTPGERAEGAPRPL